MAVHVEEVPRSNLLLRWLAPAFTIVRTHRRAYLWLNGLYYGLMLLGILYTFYDATLQGIVTAAVGTHLRCNESGYIPYCFS